MWKYLLAEHLSDDEAISTSCRPDRVSPCDHHPGIAMVEEVYPKTFPMAKRPNGKRTPPQPDMKRADLRADTTDGADQVLTTNQGLPISDNQNSLKAGPRGPSLLEDHILREKITHFDHERIPERVVHARGAGAHGHFQVYKSLAPWTKAALLNDPGRRTPVLVRFSTVAGSTGSADLAWDVRGFPWNPPPC